MARWRGRLVGHFYAAKVPGKKHAPFPKSIPRVFRRQGCSFSKKKVEGLNKVEELKGEKTLKIPSKS